MMNWKAMLAIAASTLLAVGCETRVDETKPAAAADSVASQAELERIAGDKRLIVDVMKRALDRGTLDDAIELAMQDTVFANQVIATVAADPRLSGAFAPKKAETGSKGSASRATAPRTTRASAVSGTTRRNEDALDRAERTTREANEKIDQAARVKDQAAEAKRKIEQILRP